MRVLLSNNTGTLAKWLHSEHPDQIGHLISPGGWRKPFAWFALDNGCFNPDWDADAYRRFLDAVFASEHRPQWMAVPDSVCDCDETRRRWDEWAPRLEQYKTPLAYVVQDGETADRVPKEASVLFVGGSTAWKMRTMPQWCEAYDRVHVGRINGKHLWTCQYYGAESCDGTGWFRGDRMQLATLLDFLDNPDRTRCADETDPVLFARH